MSLIKTIALIFILPVMASANPCQEYKCDTVDFKEISCQGLRDAIVSNEALLHGSSYKFNNLGLSKSEQKAVCHDFYGSDTVPRAALTTVTADVFSCVLSDIAFRCVQKGSQH